MKVLVAGARGKTARRLVRMLAEGGHEVRGLVRKEEQLPDVEADGAEPVLVDLEEEEAEGAVGLAVEGCDAIIFAAGAGERGRPQGDDGLRGRREARRGGGDARGEALSDAQLDGGRRP